MTIRFLLSAVGVAAAVAAMASAAERHALSQAPPSQGAPSTRTKVSRPCKAEVACCPEALRNYAREYHGRIPERLDKTTLDLSAVARPYPCKVAILGLGVDERGYVSSSCVLRGVRDDFDKAAQAATRKWRYSVADLFGQPIGLVRTVTVAAPATDCGGE